MTHAESKSMDISDVLLTITNNFIREIYFNSF